MSTPNSQTPRRAVPPERPGAPDGARARNRERRIAALVHAGRQRFLVEGTNGARVEDIARDAGMAKGSFYRYFGGRTDLVREILAPVRSGLVGALDGCAAELAVAVDADAAADAYAGLAGSVAALALTDPDTVRLYLQEARAPAVGDRGPVVALAEEIDARARALSRLAVDRGLVVVPDPDVSAIAVVGAVEALALAVLQGRLATPTAEIADTLISLVLRGVAGGA